LTPKWIGRLRIANVGLNFEFTNPTISLIPTNSINSWFSDLLFSEFLRSLKTSHHFPDTFHLLPLTFHQ